MTLLSPFKIGRGGRIPAIESGPQLGTFIVGEVGKARADISDAISKVGISFTSDLVSEVVATLADPDLKMHNAGYFVIRRPVSFDGFKYEVSSVEISSGLSGVDTVDVRCRPVGIQKLKRDKGAANFGSISPTKFAEMKAAEFGMRFFGEPSAGKTSIIRRQSETVDESSWDVLRTLAGDLEYVVFIADNILFFASEKYIVSKQPTVSLSWPRADSDDFQLLDIPQAQRSDDNPLGAEIRVQLDRFNATQIRPGMGLDLTGLRYFESVRYMVTDVEYLVSRPDPVSIAARATESTSDVGCEKRTFTAGTQGDCVLRIQQAVGYKSTGYFDTPTERAVKAWQTKNGFTADGVVTPKIWAAFK